MTTMPPELAERVAKLEKLGWQFHSSSDPDKTYRHSRVFANKNRYYNGATRDDTFQWIGSSSFSWSWHYVVKEVEKIECHNYCV